MLSGRIGHTVKPDLDNLCKQLKDAMTRLRFWQDDRQVVRLVCEKVYGLDPCWKISVRNICEARGKTCSDGPKLFLRQFPMPWENWSDMREDDENF